jgi:hypothetical protein
VGAGEPGAPAPGEATVKYHPDVVCGLTIEDGTAAGGEFDWGGRLLKGNGGAQWSPQAGWKPATGVHRRKGA